MSTIRCNLCGAELPAEQPALWIKDGFEIVRCKRCGLTFRRQLPTPAEVLAIYVDHYFRRPEGSSDAQGYSDYLQEEREHRMIARRRLDRLSRALTGGRLLDVACAAGFFVDEAVERGWQAQGIDVSPEMTAWAREHLGREVETGLFQRAEYAEDSFDCVTMWDYIEHSVDPAADFAKAAAVLRPGGRLMLTTGDVTSVVARLSGQRWHLMTPRHHNFFFSPGTLRAYLNQAGFQVMSIDRPSAYYSLRYITYKFGTMAPRSKLARQIAEWIGQRRLGDRAVALNLFDIVTVDARRLGAVDGADGDGARDLVRAR